MAPTLALIALLAACPWFDPGVPVEVLPPPAFEELAHRLGFGRGINGLATWLPSTKGPQECVITLRAQWRAEVACHEYRHCAEGHWHE